MEWLTGLFGQLWTKPPANNKVAKSRRNKKFSSPSTIPPVQQTGKKRSAHQIAYNDFLTVSPQPPRKKPIASSPISLKNSRSPKIITPRTTPISTPQKRSSFPIPQEPVVTPMRYVPQSPIKKIQNEPEIIEISSDDESDPTDTYSRHYEDQVMDDYVLAAYRAYKLGREQYYASSLLESSEDSEDIIFEANNFISELPASPLPSRDFFERTRATKIDLAEKSRQLLHQRAEAFELEQEKLIAAAERMRPLSEEENQVVDKILYSGRDYDTIVDDITRKDLRTLQDGEWLNDIVINSYLALISKRSKKYPKRYPKIHHMTSYFYSTLTRTNKFDYSRVRRWTSKIDIFDMDKILIPIHLGNHWTMLVIQMKKRHIDYYDSLGGSHRCVEDMKKYLKEEYKDKKKMDLKDQWTHKYHTNIPHQKNGYDCGVFACRFAECEARNSPFDFSQANMTYFRKRMILEIVTNQIAL